MEVVQLSKYLPHATIAGWLAAALTGWLWLQARDDVAQQQEQCNREKVEAIAEAERVAREASEKAAAEAVAVLAQRLETETKARYVAAEAARIANSRPERVREVIRRVADADSCVDMPVPADIVGSLRD